MKQNSWLQKKRSSCLVKKYNSETVRMKKHVNIPLFIPHLGCPNQCVFCNQHTISGTVCFRRESVRTQIDAALATIPEGTACEIAYFGGSFTGIDRELMLYLLDLAEEYVAAGRVQGIRFSTRPDYITQEIVAILSRYTIRMAELGVQSMSDRVLAACKRGHTAAVTEKAFRLLQDAEIPCGGQMMIGLPLSTPVEERECAQKICAMGCTESRIYPTLVFRDTPLAEMWSRGLYTPLTVEEAVERSAAVLEEFIQQDVRCLRTGLCDSENLHGEDCLAGPVHPAMGEKVGSRVYWHRIEQAIASIPANGRDTLTISVPCGDLSLAIGQKKENVMRIKNKYSIKFLQFVENPALSRYNVQINAVSKKGGT